VVGEGLRAHVEKLRETAERIAGSSTPSEPAHEIGESDRGTAEAAPPDAPDDDPRDHAGAPPEPTDACGAAEAAAPASSTDQAPPADRTPAAERRPFPRRRMVFRSAETSRK
jgi:hypothetical protein